MRVKLEQLHIGSIIRGHSSGTSSFSFPPGIDANIKDSLGRTVLDILKEHPSQKSLQIATLLQGKQYRMVDDFALQPRLN